MYLNHLFRAQNKLGLIEAEARLTVKAKPRPLELVVMPHDMVNFSSICYLYIFRHYFLPSAVVDENLNLPQTPPATCY